MDLERDFLVEMFRRIVRIRAFEDAAVRLGQQGKVPGALHTSHGQEGEIVGACMALRTDDYMVGNHRSHGHPIAKGARLRGLMAELFGKATGVNQGKGGSMHLADFSVGSLGETSIVGSGIPVAAGAALGAKMMKTGRVCLCFFGDGATNEGAFHEGLNLAAVWKLPAIFLCENNSYGLTTPASEVVAVKDIAERAKSYAIPGLVVDGQDAVAVHKVVSEMVERARTGVGPSLIEAKTYRFKEHAAGLGREFKYRTDEEIATWQKRDPVIVMRERLLKGSFITPEQIAELESEVAQEIADAVQFAEDSPLPLPSSAYEHLFANPIRPVSPGTYYGAD